MLRTSFEVRETVSSLRYTSIQFTKRLLFHGKSHIFFRCLFQITFWMCWAEGGYKILVNSKEQYRCVVSQRGGQRCDKYLRFNAAKACNVSGPIYLEKHDDIKLIGLYKHREILSKISHWSLVKL